MNPGNAVDFDISPFVVIWENTRACDLSCVHCRAAAQPKRNRFELSTEEGFQLIDQIAELKPKVFVLTGGDPLKREDTYALIQYDHHGTQLAALLHGGQHIVRAQQHLTSLIRDLLTEAAAAGELRDDVAPDELASYCLHALAAATTLKSKPAVRRLVAVTLAALRPAQG